MMKNVSDEVLARKELTKREEKTLTREPLRELLVIREPSSFSLHSSRHQEVE